MELAPNAGALHGAGGSGAGPAPPMGPGVVEGDGAHPASIDVPSRRALARSESRSDVEAMPTNLERVAYPDNIQGVGAAAAERRRR
jgi:hypothetical protein